MTKNLSNKTALDDDSIMYFGKWAGKRLGDVPDYYWRWFLSQEWCDDHPKLVEYANIIGDN